MQTVATQEELGSRVRQARLARGQDQSALGRAADLDRTAISKIESGARGVSALELTRIATALRLTVPDLVYVPTPTVLSRRAPLTESASGQEAARFEAETALDALLRDAEQLRTGGHLKQGVDIGGVRWAGADDALALAGRVRAAARLGTRPIGTIADLCGQFGLWVTSVGADVDGMSTTPDPGFGVAVVGAKVFPGRRRATAAHELGHHLSGDEYSYELSVSASHDERESLIELFAAELLLPTEVCAARLAGTGDQEAWAEMVRICAEYRVSWSLGLRVVRRAFPGTTTLRFDTTPVDADFLAEHGAKPLPDLEPRTMAAAWVQACMAAVRAADITPARAAEMMRTGATAAELQIR